MQAYRVAQVRWGRDFIIVPFPFEFAGLSRTDRQALVEELQRRASAVGMPGLVVPVWDRGGHRTAVMVPEQWRSHFANVSLAWVHAHLNGTLSW